MASCRVRDNQQIIYKFNSIWWENYWRYTQKSLLIPVYEIGLCEFTQLWNLCKATADTAKPMNVNIKLMRCGCDKYSSYNIAHKWNQHTRKQKKRSRKSKKKMKEIVEMRWTKEFQKAAWRRIVALGDYKRRKMKLFV